MKLSFTEKLLRMCCDCIYLFENTGGASGGLVAALLVYMSSLLSVMTVLNCVKYGSICARFLPHCAFNWTVPARSQIYVVPVLCRSCRLTRESQLDHIGHCCSKQKSPVCLHQFFQLSGPFPRLILTSALWWAPLCSTPRSTDIPQVRSVLCPQEIKVK